MMAEVSSIESNQPLNPREDTQDDDESYEEVTWKKEYKMRICSDYIKKNIKMRICSMYIKENIKMRICSDYVPLNEEKDSDCQCGYSKADHASDQPKQEVPSSSTKLEIDFERKITPKPTNAFGEIEFAGFEGNTAKFVRVDSNTDMSKILDLMSNMWEMEMPGMLISVTSGAKNFNIKPHLRDMLRLGLTKIARKTDAWIITEGFHAGVAKHVGQAAKYSLLTNQEPVVVIGIAPWGVIHNRKDLVDTKGSWPASYNIGKNSNATDKFLNPNHSHFILVDDGTQHQFGGEIQFRNKLQSKLYLAGAPVVLLVLEGGPDTLEMVENAVKDNTPVVIVKGSGGAADILAYAFEKAVFTEVNTDNDSGGDVKKTLEPEKKEDLKKEISNRMKQMKFCEGNDSDSNSCRIIKCLEKFDLIHVFEWGSGSKDIGDTMLEAVLKATEKELKEQLRLALHLNWIDFAKREIFTAEKGLQPEDLNELMLSAIQMDRVDFVELFLDHGVKLKTFLTVKRLQDLYSSRVSSKSIFMVLLCNIRSKKKNDKVCAKSTSEDLQLKENDESNKEITLMEVGQLIEDLLGDSYLEHYKCKHHKNKTGGMPEKPKFENPCLHLLIWSVLNNQQDMAKLFWQKGKDAMAAALIAHALFSAMSCRFHDDKYAELSEQIRKNIGEFMDLATGVLDLCYRANDTKTQDLMTGELLEWKKASCLKIAMETNNQIFICHTACQELFKNIWMGHLTQKNGHVKLLTCIAIPLLIPLWANFKENEDSERASGDDATPCMQQENQETEGRSTNTSSQQSQFPLQSTWKIKIQKDNPLIRVHNKVNFPYNRKVKGECGRVICNSCMMRHGRKECKRKVDNKRLNIVNMFSLFYRAPVVIFLLNVISYMVFLSLYSYILISKFDQNLSEADIILNVWVFAILIEEIRQVCTAPSKHKKTKLQSYIADGWNKLDVLTIFLFVIGMILKNIPHQQTFEAAHIILGFNLVTFFLRLLHIFSMNKELGPKLVMIFQMVQNVTSFLVIFLVFIVAYAVASHAILFPNTELNLKALNDIFRRPYWSIYGEFMLDDIEGMNACTDVEELYRNGTQSRCPTEFGKYFVLVLMGVYMLMCNIILLNLLIAIFSNTYEEVQANAEKHYHIQRYNNINEYLNRPSFVPPFSLIEHVLQLVQVICRRDCSKYQRKEYFVKPFSNESKREELRQWEIKFAGMIPIKSKPTELESIDKRVETITLRLDQMVYKIDELQEQQQAGTATVEAARLSPSQNGSLSEQQSSTVIEPGSANSENRMDKIEKQLQWIVDSLKERHLGAERAVPGKTDERTEG